MKRCIVVLLAGLLFALFHSSAANAAAPPPPTESGTIAASEQTCYCNGTHPYCTYCGEVTVTFSDEYRGSGGGITSCCSTYYQISDDGSGYSAPRPATEEERKALADAVRTQVNTLPPGLERDREFARLLGEYGFLEDQLNALQYIVELDRVSQLQEVTEVMNLYARIGQPETGLRYAEEINRRLPATLIQFVRPVVVDFNAATRVELLQSAAAVASANQLEDEAARLNQQADALQAQIDSFDLAEVINQALGIAQ